jgi:type I restriction enzyme R subunit
MGIRKKHSLFYMPFTEDSRVKIPAVLHFTRLGYDYLSLKDSHWQENTNIFPEIFADSLQSINPQLDPGDIDRELREISLLLENEDLGRAFYSRLTSSAAPKWIDFEHFERNRFHVVTELPCRNDDEEFRPDITLLINGMPLAFIEVKKPNNAQLLQNGRLRRTRAAPPRHRATQQSTWLRLRPHQHQRDQPHDPPRIPRRIQGESASVKKKPSLTSQK